MLLKPNVLYVFGGEKAQGAEIVIERLIDYNSSNVNAHLFIAPGRFADKLLDGSKPYSITLISDLKKLNRSSTSVFLFYLKAIKNYFTISYKAFRYIRRHNIHIIHSNTIVPSSYLIPLIVFSKTFFIPVKFLWSDHDLKYYSTLDHLLSNVCLGMYNYTITVSEAVKKKFKKSRKTLLLYNGLDTEIFKPDLKAGSEFRSRWNIVTSNKVLGMAGVVSPIKGQLDLIKVFNKILVDFPDTILLFAGGFANDTPQYSEEVKAAIDNCEKISHLGFIDKITDFYNGCDIIISNSNLVGSEPLGTSIYEAMACEKIVVCSATGGTVEIVTDKKDGFLFEPENVEQLEERLRYVLTQNESLDNIRLAARQKVIDKFNIFKMIQQYNEIIMEVKN